MAELEGFICPLCMQSLPGVVQLEEHAREKHSDSTTGRMMHNFKQFLGKAKTSLSMKTEENISEGAAAVATPKGGVSDSSGSEAEYLPITNISGIDQMLWPSQEQGHCRDLMGTFRATRDTKVQRIAVETNRLLVRLEKLLKLLKNEHSMKTKQLKALEQDIVPWKKDSNQKWCMKCCKEFNVRRRRHHCRLCGDIMCKRCSSFYPFSEAYQLMSNSPDYQSLLPPSGARSQSAKKKFKNILKDSDDEDDEDSSEEMRVCPHCEELLVRKLARMQSERKRVITTLYKEMLVLMEECDKRKPPYLEMAVSLLNGEFHFTLQDAQEKRQTLIRMYEGVDKISKRVLNLSPDGGGDPTPANMKLQKSIRVYASNYLQDNLLTLEGLPTRMKLREIRERKEREAEELRQNLIRQKEQQRIQEEEEAAAAAIASKKDKLEVSFNPLDSKIRLSPTLKKARAVLGIGPKQSGKTSSGWTAEPVISSTLDDEFDPFELQRQQLLSYIEQAKDAKRFDEVEALQLSLVEIESMMEQSET